MRKNFPVYDICAINGKQAENDLLIDRLEAYLERHYFQLQHAHRHSFYHFVMFTSGQGSHTIDFQTFTLEPNQVYFMSPGQVHSWHFEQGVQGYVVHFNEPLLADFLRDEQFLHRLPFFQSVPSACVYHLHEAYGNQAIALFESMLGEMETKGPGYLDLVRLRMIELFILADRHCALDRIDTERGPRHALLRTYQNLINTHFRSLKLPSQYAELLYITPNHLNALCQELLGKTAGDLIRDRVLLEAKRLLTNAALTVAQVADQLQFADNSYFNRYFKKAEGLTPEAFRKQFLQHSNTRYATYKA